METAKKTIRGSMYWCGIDPGKRGAICLINKHSIIVDMMVMPENISTIHSYFEKHKSKLRHVMIEKCQPYTGQGVISTFNYAEGYGKIQGVLIAMGLPHTLIPPKTWQKHLVIKIGSRAKKDSKQKALETANRIFAKDNSFWLATNLSRKPHDGLIDSALIAEVCRRLIR